MANNDPRILSHDEYDTLYSVFKNAFAEHGINAAVLAAKEMQKRGFVREP